MVNNKGFMRFDYAKAGYYAVITNEYQYCYEYQYLYFVFQVKKFTKVYSNTSL